MFIIIMTYECFFFQNCVLVMKLNFFNAQATKVKLCTKLLSNSASLLLL